MKTDLSGFDKYTTSNWDGEGAEAVSIQTLNVARDLISALSRSIDLPDASPSVTGAIGLVWNIKNNYLYISIRNEKTAKFYLRSSTGLSEDRLIESYSADDLVIELIERILSVGARTVIDMPQIDFTHMFITVELPFIESPKPVIPDGVDKWATKPMMEAFKYKVA